MKYIIRYMQAIRLGLHVFEYVGPFPTIEHARAWDYQLRKDARANSVFIPEATCEPIYSDEATAN